MWPSCHDPCHSPPRRLALPWMSHNCLQVTCADFKTTLTGAETRRLGKDRVWTQKQCHDFLAHGVQRRLTSCRECGLPYVGEVAVAAWAALPSRARAGNVFPPSPRAAETHSPRHSTQVEKHKWVQTKTNHNENVLLVEFMDLVFTCMPRESYCRWFRSLLLYLC